MSYFFSLPFSQEQEKLRFMYLILLMTFLIHSAESTYLEDKKDLAAHITTNAKTGPVGSLSLDRSPGANLNTNLLLASFSYVVWDRFAIGTVPIMYLIDEHRLNVTAKYFFWKGKEFFWALSTQYVLYHVHDSALINNAQTRYFLEIDVYSLQLAVNYLPLSSPWSFGLSLNQIVTDATLKYGQIEKFEEHSLEPGFDISYAWNPSIDTTFGLGFLRPSGLTAFESVNFSYGASIRWNRPGKFFSAPQTGIHYSPKTGDVQYLLSTKIY
jgi:hypothetical protein